MKTENCKPKWRISLSRFKRKTNQCKVLPTIWRHITIVPSYNRLFLPSLAVNVAKHTSLKLSKQKLDTIASSQGSSLIELENQLAETRKIYDKLQDNLQGDILNNLIEVALACDENADMVLSDPEIDVAIAKLESIHGIEVDNAGIRNVLTRNGRSFDAIMELVRNLLQKDLPLDQALFKESQKMVA